MSTTEARLQEVKPRTIVIKGLNDAFDGCFVAVGASDLPSLLWTMPTDPDEETMWTPHWVCDHSFFLAWLPTERRYSGPFKDLNFTFTRIPVQTVYTADGIEQPPPSSSSRTRARRPPMSYTKWYRLEQGMCDSLNRLQNEATALAQCLNDRCRLNPNVSLLPPGAQPSGFRVEIDELSQRRRTEKSVRIATISARNKIFAQFAYVSCLAAAATIERDFLPPDPGSEYRIPHYYTILCQFSGLPAYLLEQYRASWLFDRDAKRIGGLVRATLPAVPTDASHDWNSRFAQQWQHLLTKFMFTAPGVAWWLFYPFGENTLAGKISQPSKVLAPTEVELQVLLQTFKRVLKERERTRVAVRVVFLRRHWMAAATATASAATDAVNNIFTENGPVSSGIRSKLPVGPPLRSSGQVSWPMYWRNYNDMMAERKLQETQAQREAREARELEASMRPWEYDGGSAQPGGRKSNPYRVYRWTPSGENTTETSSWEYSVVSNKRAVLQELWDDTTPAQRFFEPIRRWWHVSPYFEDNSGQQTENERLDEEMYGDNDTEFSETVAPAPAFAPPLPPPPPPAVPPQNAATAPYEHAVPDSLATVIRERFGIPEHQAVLATPGLEQPRVAVVKRAIMYKEQYDGTVSDIDWGLLQALFTLPPPPPIAEGGAPPPPSPPAWLSQLCDFAPASVYRHPCATVIPLLQIRRNISGYILLSSAPMVSSRCSLYVEDPLIVLEICRRRWGPDPTAIAGELLVRGIPFRLLRENTSVTVENLWANAVGAHFHPFRAPFTNLDYSLYRSTRDDLLQGPAGRAATRMGGVIWRLAMDALYDDDGVLAYMSDARPVFVAERIDGTVWRDDDLTRAEMDLICGLTHVRTSIDADNGSSTSWWPLHGTWSTSGKNFGYWSWANELWYRERREELLHDPTPKSATEWTKALRGDKPIARSFQSHRIVAGMSLRNLAAV